MARITANFAVDLARIDLNGLLVDASSVTLLDNVNFKSAQGYTYQDILRLAVDDTPPYQADFGGSNITYSAATGAVTGGTVTGFLANAFDGSKYVPWYAVEGFSVSAVSIYNAVITASTADDMAILQSVLSGADTFNLSGGDDAAAGFAGNDTMRGNGGRDTLDGGAGNDWIDGGVWADRMIGGAGNDSFVVNNAGDVVVELSGGGIDTVRSSRTYTLGSNVENLVLTDAVAIDGTGNGLANTITGNAAANALGGRAGNDKLVGGGANDTLDGGLGNDTMLGGAGNDTFLVDSTGDLVTEAASGGTDTVRSVIDEVLASNVENLVLAGSGAIAGTGNSLGNRITGNAAANVLAGGGGNDSLSGGAGNDLLMGGIGSDKLTGGAGADSFRFNTLPNASTNVDRVFDFASVDDRIQLENAVFTTLGATGALAAAKFHVGAGAADASDRIVYNQTTGAMFYDADGNGAGAQILFAQFDAGTVINLNDLWVI
jgi:Ca2+-binding RTX toxin-like protein